MSLKRELESASSPLRVALDAMLPDLGRHARASWNAQMKGVQPTFNPDLPPDVLGHAISERIAWQFAGITGPLHGAATLIMTGANPDVVADLADLMQAPCPGLDAAREARVACLVGLADRSMRSGVAVEPWYEPLLTATTLDDALAAVDQAWVDDVVTTTTIALEAPHRWLGKLLWCGPPPLTGRQRWAAQMPTSSSATPCWR